MGARTWGWWTEQKLDILSGYLTGFSNACSKKAGTTVYLDLFAGQAENVSRDREGRIIQGSARRALDIKPPLSVLRFFELPSNARALDQALRAEYSDRDFKVISGDCNDRLADVLRELSDVRWAPTFAFLDQQSTEVRWETVERLARHKKRGAPKTELWLLCASGLLPRGLKIHNDLDPKVIQRMNTMFNTDIWTQALEARRDGRLSPLEFRTELTNLMRWRLEQDLGYRKTRVFHVTNTSGNEIFDMIFATDHDVGVRIMDWMFNKAVREQPVLRRQAQARRKQARAEKEGGFGLFDVDDIAEAAKHRSFRVETEDAPARPPYRHP